MNDYTKDVLYKNLFYVCRDDEMELAKKLIVEGANVMDGENIAVRIAAGKGHLGMVKYLITQGADPTDSNYAAIRFAGVENKLTMVKYLIGIKAFDSTSLEVIANHANEKKHIEMLYYLLDKGVSLPDSRLISSCAKGNMNTLKFITKEGIDIHIANDEGFNIACKNGQLSVMKYIIAHRMLRPEKLDYGLVVAGKQTNFPVIKYLVSLGADLKVSDSIVFRTAYAKGCIEELISYLRENEIDIPDGIYGDKVIIINGKTHIIKFISVHEKRLMDSCFKGDLEDVINSLNWRDMLSMKTLIKLAVSGNNLDIVKYLKEKDIEE